MVVSVGSTQQLVLKAERMVVSVAVEDASDVQCNVAAAAETCRAISCIKQFEADREGVLPGHVACQLFQCHVAANLSAEPPCCDVWIAISSSLLLRRAGTLQEQREIQSRSRARVVSGYTWRQSSVPRSRQFEGRAQRHVSGR